MPKKILLFTLFIVMGFSVISCGNMGKNDVVSLSEDEKELLELINEDIHVVMDQDYAETVSELVYHTDEYSGQVYQLEGVYSVEDGTSSIFRTLVDGDSKTACGLPLKYVQKDIESGSWVKVTGVVNADDASGEGRSVLEVVAIETLSKEGQAELQWEGGTVHQH